MQWCLHTDRQLFPHTHMHVCTHTNMCSDKHASPRSENLETQNTFADGHTAVCPHGKSRDVVRGLRKKLTFVTDSRARSRKRTISVAAGAQALETCITRLWTSKCLHTDTHLFSSTHTLLCAHLQTCGQMHAHGLHKAAEKLGHVNMLHTHIPSCIRPGNRALLFPAWGKTKRFVTNSGAFQKATMSATACAQISETSVTPGSVQKLVDAMFPYGHTRLFALHVCARKREHALRRTRIRTSCVEMRRHVGIRTHVYVLAHTCMCSDAYACEHTRTCVLCAHHVNVRGHTFHVAAQLLCTLRAHMLICTTCTCPPARGRMRKQKRFARGCFALPWLLAHTHMFVCAHTQTFSDAHACTLFRCKSLCMRTCWHRTNCRRAPAQTHVIRRTCNVCVCECTAVRVATHMN